MKIVMSDKGSEYYGRYDETKQHPCPFAKLLQKRDIVTIHNVWYITTK